MKNINKSFKKLLIIFICLIAISEIRSAYALPPNLCLDDGTCSDGGTTYRRCPDGTLIPSYDQCTKTCWPGRVILESESCNTPDSASQTNSFWTVNAQLDKRYYSAGENLYVSVGLQYSRPISKAKYHDSFIIIKFFDSNGDLIPAGNLVPDITPNPYSSSYYGSKDSWVVSSHYGNNPNTHYMVDGRITYDGSDVCILNCSITLSMPWQSIYPIFAGRVVSDTSKQYITVKYIIDKCAPSIAYGANGWCDWTYSGADPATVYEGQFNLYYTSPLPPTTTSAPPNIYVK